MTLHDSEQIVKKSSAKQKRSSSRNTNWGCWA